MSNRVRARAIDGCPARWWFKFALVRKRWKKIDVSGVKRLSSPVNAGSILEPMSDT